MKLSSSVTIIPILHGKATFAQYVRSCCLNGKYDCIAVDIPSVFQDELGDAVEQLPFISAIIARDINEPVYYIPTDPCDATIEGIRQSYQNHIPFRCIGYPNLKVPKSLPPLPDEYAISATGFEAYNALCLQAIGNPPEGSDSDIEGRHLAGCIRGLETEFRNILVLVHFRNFVRTVHHFSNEKTYNFSQTSNVPYFLATHLINTDHLYFALGELPFVTGKFEKERHDLFAEPFNIINTIKDLFRETRDDYFEEKDQIAELSPVRIQAALTFLRNLTVMSERYIPSLFDIIEAAKGVGGNSYAVRILKSARYYPYIPMEFQHEFTGVGIDKINVPEWGTLRAINLFKDFEMEWKTISIKPDPSELQKKRYRFKWNPLGMCSHIPEDQRIERFNSHVRRKALRVLVEDHVKTEKFSTSVKDGIDIRETLRNWHTGGIYIKELPPSVDNVDTVVIIFDEAHDEKYTHCATWYAEHAEESTLTFYGTDPFDNLIGPGVAHCVYGGLSLLFPPRPVPNVFDLTAAADFPNLASRLTYGALLFSGERAVAYVANKKPGARLRQTAARLKKHLVWIPMNSFSNETIRKLRRFHILNGKIIRSWAGRFIGD